MCENHDIQMELMGTLLSCLIILRKMEKLFSDFMSTLTNQYDKITIFVVLQFQNRLEN